MKKAFMVIFGLMLITFALAQNAEEVDVDEFENAKIIESELEEEVKVEIRKPDNSSLLGRKETEEIPHTKYNVLKKLKESNKVLY